MEYNNLFFVLVQAVLDRPNWPIFDWNYYILHKTNFEFEVGIVIGHPIGISGKMRGQKIILDLLIE